MKYQVLVTRNVTQSAIFIEEASTKDEAASQAMAKARAGEGNWEIDDGNCWDDIYFGDSIEESVREIDDDVTVSGETAGAVTPTVQTIDLGIGIYIQWDGQNRENAGIFHDLLDDKDDLEYEAALDGITSMVLAHFCGGVEVTDPSYIRGIQTALTACAENL